MKVILLTVFFCVSVVSVYSWTAIIPDESLQSEHGGYCYSDSYKIGALKKYEEKRIKSICAVAACLESKDISIYGCGVYSVEPPCYVVPGNLSKPYPDCCFEVKCPENI